MTPLTGTQGGREVVFDEECAAQLMSVVLRHEIENGGGLVNITVKGYERE